MTKNIKLDYKAMNIYKAEKEEGLKMFEVLSGLGESFSISNLVFLLKAGGASEDEINQQVAVGLKETFEVIVEGLSEAGFLGNINTAEIKKTLADTMESPSENIGKA